MKTVPEASYRCATHYKLKISPQDLNILESILPPSEDKPKSGVVKYNDTSDDSDEDEQVNVNSREEGLYNLKQRIDPPHRYGENALEFN